MTESSEGNGGEFRELEMIEQVEFIRDDGVAVEGRLSARQALGREENVVEEEQLTRERRVHNDLSLLTRPQRRRYFSARDGEQ